MIQFNRLCYKKVVDSMNYEASDPVVILGFGQMGQVLAIFLSAPLASGIDGNSVGWPYVAFDQNPAVVKAAKDQGFPVLYGDGPSPLVLQSAGISSPKAVLVMYPDNKKTSEAVKSIRLTYPSYEAHLEDETLVGKSDGVEITVCDGHFCYVLPKAVKTLKKGEKVLLTVKPQYGFGPQGRPVCADGVVVSPNATPLITLELVSWKIVSNVTDAKKIVKKILKGGEGYDCPNEGVVVKCDWVVL